MNAETGDSATSATSAATAGAGRAYRPVERGGGDARLFGGVCAGLGRATGIDPIVYRVAIVVLTVSGGVGALVYAAGWLLLPAEDQSASLIENWTGRRHSLADTLALLGAIVAVGFLFSMIGGPGGTTVATLVVLALGLLAAQRRGVDLSALLRGFGDHLRGRPVSAADTADTAAAAQAPGAAPPRPGPPDPRRPDGLIDLGVYGSTPRTEPRTGPDAPPPPADGPHRQRHGWLGSLFFFAACGAGAWAMAMAAPTHGWAATVTWGYGAATAMFVLGAGLVIGAWFGRARSLVFWGVLLAVFLIALPMVRSGSLKGFSAQWRPTSAAQVSRPLEVGVGSGLVDLTDLPVKPGKRVAVSVDLDAGYARVVVPKSVRVRMDGAMTLGGAVSRHSDITDSGRRLRMTFGPNTPKTPVIELHLRGKLGAMEVRDAA